MTKFLNQPADQGKLGLREKLVKGISVFALSASLPLLAAGTAMAQDQLVRNNNGSGGSSPSEAGCIPTPKVDPLMQNGFSSSANIGACGNEDEAGVEAAVEETASTAQGYGGFNGINEPGTPGNPGGPGTPEPPQVPSGIFGSIDPGASDLGLSDLPDGVQYELSQMIEEGASPALGEGIADGELVDLLGRLLGGDDGDGDGDGNNDGNAPENPGIFATLGDDPTSLDQGISNELGAMTGEQYSKALGAGLDDPTPLDDDSELVAFLTGLAGDDGDGDGNNDGNAPENPGVFATLGDDPTSLDQGISNELGAMTGEQYSKALGAGLDDPTPLDDDSELVAFLTGLAGDDGDGDGNNDGNAPENPGIFATLGDDPTSLDQGISNELGAMTGEQYSKALGAGLDDPTPLDDDSELVAFLTGLAGDGAGDIPPGGVPTDPPGGIPPGGIPPGGVPPGGVPSFPPEGCDTNAPDQGCLPDTSLVTGSLVGAFGPGGTVFPGLLNGDGTPNTNQEPDLSALNTLIGSDGFVPLLDEDGDPQFPQSVPGDGDGNFIPDQFEQGGFANQSASAPTLTELPSVGSLPVPETTGLGGIEELAGLIGDTGGITEEASQLAQGTLLSPVTGIVGSVVEAATGGTDGGGGLLGGLL